MRPATERPKVLSRKAPRKRKITRASPAGEGAVRSWLDSSRFSDAVKDSLHRFSGSTLPVFLQGEEGTGRHLAARAIHSLGPLRKSPFVRFSCRDLTAENLVHRISSWGKNHPREKVVLTLYLEDVEKLDSGPQIILLELLGRQRLSWPAVGGISFNIRLLSSSTLPLADASAAGRFRRDLCEALGTLTLTLQPLRERKEEIPQIASDILEEKRGEKIFRKSFSSGAFRSLQRYGWPGNLAELESVVLRSAASKDGDVLLPDDLLFRPSAGESPRPAPQPEEREPWFDVILPTLAHEIKNPLVAISTFAHLLPEKYDEPEFRQEFSRLVNQDIRRVNDVIEDLLEFSQFSAPRTTRNDLNFAVAGVLKQQEKPLQRWGGRVIADLDAAVPPVIFDEGQLNFVLRNVLENAIARIRPETPLRLSTRVSEGRETGGSSRFVDFSLSYDGREGIVARTQETVGFGAEPDFQNLSLILLLIRKVVNRNRGTMQVREEGEDGMVIRFQFPAAPERGERKET